MLFYGDRVRDLATKGFSRREICSRLGCSKATVDRALRTIGPNPWIEADVRAARASLAREVRRARDEMANTPPYKFRAA